jgi:uncharacterized membrane protein
MKRIYSIDFTRGLVMIIMVLDHVRDLMHTGSVTHSPTDLSTTTPILFFTRWITYLCAPIFVFLAGTSAYLSFKRKSNVTESRKFLLKRGGWLILLEFTVVNFGLFFDPGFHTLIFEVIAAIGFGFVMLSLMLRLSLKTICITGMVIIFCHALVSLIPLPTGSTANMILSLFFNPGASMLTSAHAFVMAYPPIPWLGIMLIGFATGKLFELNVSERKKIFIRIGFAALGLFVILRFINVYGDPSPWSHQKNAVFSFLSFMNITKYPPSLLFCLITLGMMFLILAAAENAKGRVQAIPIVYGKTPLFYFIVHFYLVHFLLVILLLLQGFHWADLDFASGNFGRPKGAASGIPLWVVYLVWIAVVAVLYKPCVWFGRYKSEHKYWWLKYI